MKVLSAEAIRLWDQYTIQHEPISSVDLMERAATRCVEWLKTRYTHTPEFNIFCGKGNNGGDGLAIARLLSNEQIPVTVFILEFGHKGTDDFQINLARLHQITEVEIRFIQTEDNFPTIAPHAILIDALLGSGLNRALEGVTSRLVEYINQSGNEIISIDIPSGLFVDHSSRGNMAIQANHTLSFQCYKPAFLVPENENYIGTVHILDIGLHPEYYRTIVPKYEMIGEEFIHSIYRPRKRFSHKGNFGHALLVAGSYGKIGAAVLSARACLHSGIGLLTCHTPQCGYDIMQSSVPEAMLLTDFNSSFSTRIDDDVSKFTVMGIGPGMGTASETRLLIKEILDGFRKPLVLDADALNTIAAQPDLLERIPVGSLLTPHPKEFERLFGETSNDFEQVNRALEKAGALNCVIVLKGHHTFIATPSGRGYFNTTGNAGMATAGSGDVLTGILTALLAQYEPTNAAILGVYLHGLAGDIAAREQSEEALVASDLINKLGYAFLQIQY